MQVWGLELRILYLCVCVYVGLWVSVHVTMCVCVWVCGWVGACMHVCVCEL